MKKLALLASAALLTLMTAAGSASAHEYGWPSGCSYGCGTYQDIRYDQGDIWRDRQRLNYDLHTGRWQQARWQRWDLKHDLRDLHRDYRSARAYGGWR